MSASSPRMMSCGLVLAACVALLAALHTARAEGHIVVGQIFVTGNTETPRWVIHHLLAPIQVTSKVTEADLRRAESRLRRAGLFRHDPRLGAPTTIEVLPAETAGEPYSDIIVAVTEREWNWLWFACADLTEGWRTGDRGRLNAAALRVRDGVVKRLPERRE